MVRRIAWLWLLALLAAPSAARAQRSTLDLVRERGVVRVGTTGDYRPFSYLNPSTGELEGLDVDTAHALAGSLGVEVEFITTTWPALTADLIDGRYDIAMGGITRTLARIARVGLTDAYATLGKCPLIRTADRAHFRSLQEIDRPGVRIGVNPGGTNETFVRSAIAQADIVVIQANLAIPDALAAGDVDVMITDNVEAVLVAAERPELYAVAPDAPLSHDDLGYMVRRDDQPFLNYLNLWLQRLRSDGGLARLERRWLRR